MAESSGSAEVGVLALKSSLFFMGGMNSSEHCFFPLSIKHLNTSKEDKRRKMGPSACSWEVQEVWSSRSRGKASLCGGRAALRGGRTRR